MLASDRNPFNEMSLTELADASRGLSRMADVVLGTRATLWISPHVGAFDERPLYKASASDEGLYECLQELEALARCGACSASP